MVAGSASDLLQQAGFAGTGRTEQDGELTRLEGQVGGLEVGFVSDLFADPLEA